MTGGGRYAIPILIGTALLLGIPVLSLAQTTAHENCPRRVGEASPKFKVERQFRGDRGPSLLLFVSVHPNDISRDAILALACQLGQSHSSEPLLFVWIFDSRKAAKDYNPQGEGNTRETLRALVGAYRFNKDSTHRYHSLDWYETPGDSRSIERIDLGVPPDPELR